LKRRGLRCAFQAALCVLAALPLWTIPGVSWAYQPTLSEKEVGSSTLDLKKLRGGEEEPESLLDFFKRRTRIGAGFEEEFNSNILIQDNARQEDIISTLESALVFADPRGNLLYGMQYEVNAYRYHRANRNAIDHDLVSFADFDTGGRLQFHLEHVLVARNSLVLGADGGDILRRSSDFQRTVEHVGMGSIRYALNETNALVPKVDYSLFDDQSVFDASTDRKRLRAIFDLDHDLTPAWTVFGGYSFQDISVPGERVKDSDTHAARLGVRHDLGSGEENLEATLEAQHAEFKEGQAFSDLGFTGKWTHEAGPRTKLTLGYSDLHDTSFSIGRFRYRAQSPSFKILYQWTPLVDLEAGAVYTRQSSGGKDIVPGNNLVSDIQKQYSLITGFHWQMREQTRVNLDYRYTRSTSRDYTQHTVHLQFETTF